MAYIQKGNPFKQTSKSQMIGAPSQGDIDLAQRLNKIRFEMGQIYPIYPKEEVLSWYDYEPRHAKGKRSRDRNLKKSLHETAQTEKERLELYERDPSGEGRKKDPSTSQERWDMIRLERDLQFIKVAKEAGGDTFDKLISLPNEDLVNFQNEVIKVAAPLVGEEFVLSLKKPIKSAKTLSAIKEIDLTGFKPYLEKAGINKSDIKKIVTAQINNLPDSDGDGTPDIFDGETLGERLKGNVLKAGVNTLIENKLNSLD